MKRLFSAVVLVVLGCSNDLDALYAKTSHAADSGAAVGKPVPELPAQPDDKWQARCELCAKSMCSEPRGDCLEDDGCTEELRCKGMCHDPACLQTCSAEFGWSPWYTDYARCVFGQCRTDCNIGNNWQCQGNYDWPSSKTSSFEVTFRFDAPYPTWYTGGEPHVAGNGPVGEMVRACSYDQPECDDSVADDGARIGIDDTVKLELGASTFPPEDFRGYLDIGAGEPPGNHSRLYAAPLARSQEFFAGFMAAYVGPPTLDVARPRVVAAVADCLVTPVSNAIVTLPELPEIRAVALENRLAWPEGPTMGIGIVELNNLPDSAKDSMLWVRAERGDTHERISQQAVYVRPGMSTMLVLMPATRSE